MTKLSRSRTQQERDERKREADARLLWWLELGGIVIFGWVFAAGTAAMCAYPPYQAQLFWTMLEPRMWLCPAVLWLVLGVPAMLAPPRSR